jgi:hypothetical protein
MKIGANTVSGLYLGSTAASRAYLGASLVWEAGASIDPDAAAYITAVETADAAALEAGVKAAINDFVVGCKADGIWSALKASCILAGARTLNGALVPLVGAAPTNFNFVSGDYNRKTGLVGDGSTKYLNSNRANNADPQNINHNSVWISNLGSVTNQSMMGANDSQGAGSGSNLLFKSGSNTFTRSRSATGTTGGSISVGIFGISRSSSTSYVVRNNAANSTVSVSSDGNQSNNVLIFRRLGTGSVPSYSDARFSFYSIGESLDLAALDTRVSALMNALDGAIA